MCWLGDFHFCNLRQSNFYVTTIIDLNQYNILIHQQSHRLFKKSKLFNTCKHCIHFNNKRRHGLRDVIPLFEAI